MTPDLIATYTQGSAVGGEGFARLLLALAIFDAVLKGIALRKAGTKKHIVRFVCLFIFNTVGILPIVYLIWFAKKDKMEKDAEKTISKVANKIEKGAEKVRDETEDKIEDTIEKVEQLIKKAPVIGKKTPAKKSK